MDAAFAADYLLRILSCFQHLVVQRSAPAVHWNRCPSNCCPILFSSRAGGDWDSCGGTIDFSSMLVRDVFREKEAHPITS